MLFHTVGLVVVSFGTMIADGSQCQPLDASGLTAIIHHAMQPE